MKKIFLTLMTVVSMKANAVVKIVFNFTEFEDKAFGNSKPTPDLLTDLQNKDLIKIKNSAESANCVGTLTDATAKKKNN
jgi:hypothetical protein